MIENDRRHVITNRSSNRSFGLMMGVFFLIVGVVPLLSGKPIAYVPVGISSLFLFAALVIPHVLSPLNRLWFKFGLLLHKIVSPVVLGILFYVILSPVALLRRFFTKDPLKLGLDEARSTYWVDRSPPGPKPQSMTDQF